MTSDEFMLTSPLILSLIRQTSTDRCSTVDYDFRPEWRDGAAQWRRRVLTLSQARLKWPVSYSGSLKLTGSSATARPSSNSSVCLMMDDLSALMSGLRNGQHSSDTPSET